MTPGAALAQPAGVATALGVLPPPDEDAALRVGVVMQNARIPRSEAERRLALQDAAPDPNATLRVVVGDKTYGGAWIDDSDGRLKVGVKGHASDGAVRAFLAGLRVDTTDVVSVASSAQDLADALRATNTALADLLRDDTVQTGIDDARNAVVVRVTHGARVRQPASVEATSGDPVRIIVEQRPASDTPALQTACTFPNCSPPLRGGIRIDSAYTWCSRALYRSCAARR